MKKLITVFSIFILAACSKDKCQECPERFVPVNCNCECIGLQVGTTCFDSTYMSEQTVYLHDTSQEWCEDFKFMKDFNIVGFQRNGLFEPTMPTRVLFFKSNNSAINYHMQYVSPDSLSARHIVAETYMDHQDGGRIDTIYAPGKMAFLQCNIKKTSPKSFNAYFYWRDSEDGSVIGQYCIRRFYQL